MSRPYFSSSFGGGNNWSFIHPKGWTTQMAPSNAVPPQSTPAPISEYVGLRALGMKPTKELPCLAPAIALLSTTSSPLSSCRAHKLPHVFAKPVDSCAVFRSLSFFRAYLFPRCRRLLAAPVQMLTYFLQNFLASNHRTPSAATREEIGKVRRSERASEHSSRSKGHTRVGLQPPHNSWTYPWTICLPGKKSSSCIVCNFFGSLIFLQLNFKFQNRHYQNCRLVILLPFRGLRIVLWGIEV